MHLTSRIRSVSKLNRGRNISSCEAQIPNRPRPRPQCLSSKQRPIATFEAKYNKNINLYHFGGCSRSLEPRLCARWISSDTEPSTTQSSIMKKLQRSLKRFYRLVHPDLFAKYPLEKEVNQRSFQLLREFLEHFDDTSKRSHELREFSVGTGVNSAITEKFRKGVCVLKTPAANVSRIWRERHLEHSLSKLYKVCGVETDLKSEKDQIDVNPSDSAESFTAGFEYDNERRTQENTLLDILFQYSNQARRIIHQRYEEERRVDIAQTIFYIQEKIRIYWQLPEDRTKSMSVLLRFKFELLHRLHQAVSLCKQWRPDAVNLKNSTVVLAARRGVDPLGRILLHIDDTHESWAQILGRYDPQVQVSKRDGGKSRELLEKDAASKLGIAYFYSDYTLSNSPEYLDFLNKISYPKDKIDGLLDLKTCTLNVPITKSFDEIVALIATHGPEIVEKYNRIIAESNEIADLMLNVKRRFRLRGLSQDSMVSNSEFHEALTRMLTYANRLKSFLDGVKIRISRGYDMNEDDGTLSVPWDFEI